MSDPADLRVSDEDRERTASEIREHYAQGRLDSDELAERLEGAYAARTSGELQAVRADLPALPAGAPATRSELAVRRSALGRELVQQIGTALVPFVVCAAVWLFSGASGSFWPAWALLVAVVPLLRNGWRLYGPSPELDRVAEDLEQQRRRHGRRHGL